MKLDWKPIAELPESASFPVLFAWQASFPSVGVWWEYDTEFVDCAQYWARFEGPNV